MNSFKPQPAVVTYFLGPAYKEYYEIFSTASIDAYDFANRRCQDLAKGGTSDFVSALGTVAALAGGLAYALTAAALIAVLAASFGVVLLLGSLIVLLGIAGLLAFDWIWSKVWRLGRPCPRCFDRDANPYFLCPACGAKHTLLNPGLYGVFRRFCTCGANLPVVHALGRRFLESFCSRCDEPLLNVQSSDCHVAFIGGPSSGKSSLFFMCLREMAAGYGGAGYDHMKYADANVARYVNSQIQLLESGKPVLKTSEITPKAIQFILNRPNLPVGSSVYFYDVAGEAYNADASAAQLAFFDHIDGLVFVVDPLSIEAVETKWEAEIRRLNLEPCKDAPESAYSRMLASLESYCRRGRAGIKKARVSVVISKCDVFNIRSEIEAAKGRALAKIDGKKPLPPEAATSVAVRQWLIENGEGNLVRLIESDFAQVSYFVVSALGRTPASGETKAFTGEGVLVPIVWSLARRLKWKTL